MKQVLQHVRSSRLEVADVPEPAGKAGGVVIRNVASLISAGTEKMVIDFAGKSLMGKARERPDLVQQVLTKVKKEGVMPTVQTVLSRLDQPIPLGYSCAGVVESVGRGAEEFSVGQPVACAGMGYASHADVVFVPRNLTVAIPQGVAFEDAAYVTLGAIALQGVRVADVRLGETVAVIGLGLLGQLCVQILAASGCRVIGIDLDPAKVAMAKELGAEVAICRGDGAEAAVAAFTRGVGADAVVIAAATPSNDPVELAGEISRERGRISVIGAVGMEIPRKVYYEKELELCVSRSYGPGRYDPEYEERGRDYPIAYVRWTERRNMEEFLRLVAAGQVTPSRLTTHRFPIEEAEHAYELVSGKADGPFSGILLTYSPAPPSAEGRTVALRAPAARAGAVGVGFIGAGNFAKSVLLPRFRKRRDARMVGIATASGMSGASAGEKFGFEFCTTDMERVLSDEAVEAVVIATRHGSHAHFAAAALRSGKSVFVEKPLAISEGELQTVLEAQAQSGQLLTVGFNRRFSGLSAQLKEAFAPGAPLAVNYRINAGPVPRSSWIHHPDEGGGRVIGEVCHFLDLVQFVTDETIVEVFAHGLGGPEGELHDTLTMSVRLGRGSIAAVTYFATGDPALSKERIEVYGGGVVAVLDDFRKLTISRGGKRTRRRPAAQDKGFDREIESFLAGVRGGATPIPLETLVATTRATFAIEESLRTGLPVPVAPLG